MGKGVVSRFDGTLEEVTPEADEAGFMNHQETSVVEKTFIAYEY